MTTFTYDGTTKVTIRGGKIVESNYEGFPVGMPMTVARFAQFGWNRVKAPTVAYAKGLSKGRSFKV